MQIEQDSRRLQYVIKIDREEFNRAFTSQVEYDALIVKISKLIYEQGKGRML